MPPTRPRNHIHVAVDGIAASLSHARASKVVAAVLRGEKVRSALVSVAFLSRAGIARMNRDHLGHSGPTDVISFGFERPTSADPVVGDIYIAPEIGRMNALARGVGIREELVRLLVHGTLHVLGHDHPDSDDRTTSPMWKRQERYVRRLTAASK